MLDCKLRSWVCGFVSRDITLIASVDRTKTKNTKAVTTNIRPVNAFRRHTYIRLVYIDEYFISSHSLTQACPLSEPITVDGVALSRFGRSS